MKSTGRTLALNIEQYIKKKIFPKQKHFCEDVSLDLPHRAINKSQDLSRIFSFTQCKILKDQLKEVQAEKSNDALSFSRLIMEKSRESLFGSIDWTLIRCYCSPSGDENWITNGDAWIKHKYVRCLNRHTSVQMFSRAYA